MTGTDLVTLLPFLWIAFAAIVVMLLAAFHRRHRLALLMTLAGIALAFSTLPGISSRIPRHIDPLLVVDSYALFYIGLLLAGSFVVALLSYSTLEHWEGNREEFYVLLLLATLGGAVLVASNHFISLFLGLEILTVCLYVLIAYPTTGQAPLEAGLKYLILAAASSSFLLFGMALIYAELGTMDFTRMASILGSKGYPASSLILAGMGMLVVGIGFKLALVPFHMWTPDVYEGAPAPVTAFVATVSKGAMFALLLRFFMQAGGYQYPSVLWVFGLLAAASMFVGNLLALLQDNVKRILAYSSIAHLGYLLVAFLASGNLAVEAVTFYLVAYFITTLGSFGVVTVLSGKNREADSLADYRGLFWRRPWLGAIFSAMLLSLAGIPLTAGFVGKFYVLSAGVAGGLWLLVVLLVINSAIGLFYYLRILIVLYASAEESSGSRERLSLTGGGALAALTILLFWLGVYPSPLLRLIQAIASSLS